MSWGPVPRRFCWCRSPGLVGCAQRATRSVVMHGVCSDRSELGEQLSDILIVNTVLEITDEQFCEWHAPTATAAAAQRRFASLELVVRPASTGCVCTLRRVLFNSYITYHVDLTTSLDQNPLYFRTLCIRVVVTVSEETLHAPRKRLSTHLGRDSSPRPSPINFSSNVSLDSGPAVINFYKSFII
jgi:hypothetical protein